MTPVDRENQPDDGRHFEQWLLDSARADELPRDVSGAWARFDASLAGAGALAAQGVAMRGVRVNAASGSATALAWGGRMLAIKWLLVGVLSGSAFTALALSHARDWRKAAAGSAPSTPLVASAPPASSSASGMAQVTSAEVSLPNSVASVSAATGRSAPTRRPRGAGSGDSTLGAQVALLDAARAAALSGAASEALALTDRFQHQFPRGELAPDAEVVGIEALAAEGERSTLTARIERFLARYPSDPHAERVKALLPR